MSLEITRYQLQAYIFDSGAVTRFEPHGWSTPGQILMHAPRAVRHIIVRGHTDFQVWDTSLTSYVRNTVPPPPTVGEYDDLDQAIMATALKGK